MLGFATVDVSVTEATLTVWLTSQVNRTTVTHTNAVVFQLDNSFKPAVPEGLLVDRYVVLTARTDPTAPLLSDWKIEPCDVGTLEIEVSSQQDRVLAAFQAYRELPGKADLIEPTLVALPGAVDEAALAARGAPALTLNVANRVSRLWGAWLAVEHERVRRRQYMPAGYDADAVSTLPASFTDISRLHSPAEPA